MKNKSKIAESNSKNLVSSTPNDWVKRVFKYQFKNANLLDLALSHRSIKAENSTEQTKSQNGSSDNERLEFLGDSVLGLIISRQIYTQFKKSEGELTQIRSKLVNNRHLSEIARNLGLDRHIQFGNSLVNQTTQMKLAAYANCFEALIGAIYLDSDSFEKTSTIILPIFEHRINEIAELRIIDSKTDLQQYCQKNKIKLPTYTLLSEIGEGKDKLFQIACRVQISERKMFESSGEHKQKKIAEQIAAEKIIKRLNIES